MHPEQIAFYVQFYVSYSMLKYIDYFLKRNKNLKTSQKRINIKYYKIKEKFVKNF